MKTTTILVTGGCGYLGSQLLQTLGAAFGREQVTIRILDNLQSGHLQALMRLPATGRYEFIEGDILDPSAMRRALEDVDIVVHLAAIVKTPFSFDHPQWTEQINHWGTARVVEHCIDAGVRHFIFVSSTSVYGIGGPFDESAPCQPVGPYAQSKWLAEQSVRLAARDRGLPATILRMATIYGIAPVIRFDAIVNRFAYLAGMGRFLTIHGNGEQMRPLIHISDASAAILYCLAHRDLFLGKTLNVVGENLSVRQVAEAVRIFRNDIAMRYTDQGVLTHFSLNVEGAGLAALGWQPHITVEQGLGEMLAAFSNVTSVSAAGSAIDEV